MQEEHTLVFRWQFNGQPPFEVIREVRQDSILALPQLAEEGFESVTIVREDSSHPRAIEWCHV